MTTTALETAAAPGYSVFQIPQGYWTANNSITLQCLSATTALNTFEHGQTFTASAIPADRLLNGSGSTARQAIVRDIFYYDAARNHQLINASTLSNVRLLYNGASISSIDTTYTYAGVTYVCLPLIASSLLIPKA